MSAERLDRINIALMALSGAAALAFPFELFLLVYAVLGPLHYLTEISWLHDRDYFASGGRRDAWILLAIGAIYTAVGLRWWNPSPRAPELLMLAALAMSVVFAFTSSAYSRLKLSVVAAVAVIALSYTSVSEPLTILLPTLIHVSLFTGLFVLSGALKNRRASGYISFAAFVLISLLVFFWRSSGEGPQPGRSVLLNYGFLGDDGRWNGDFLGLNFFVARLAGLLELPPGTTPGQINAFLYLAPAGRALMAFIAYSYCYHYLNWFSKTSIIGWHEVSRARLACVLVLWAASLGVYAYSYSLGLKWLFFLSFTHVLLELPLDLRTGAGVGRGVWDLIRLGRVASDPAQPRIKNRP